MRTAAMVRWVLAGLVGSAGVGSALAADDVADALRTPHNDWSIFAGVEHDSNATRTPSGASDEIGNVGGTVSVFHQTERFTGSLNGAAAYDDYVHNTVSSRSYVNAAASASYAFVPEVFKWVVSDVTGPVVQVPGQPITPNNYINANVFSTGPELALPITANGVLSLDAAYGISDFRSVNYANDHTVTGKVAWTEHLSATAEASVNADYSRVDYQLSGAATFDLRDAYLRYAARDKRQGIELDAGVSASSGGGLSSTGPLFRARLYRAITPSLSIDLKVDTRQQSSGMNAQGLLSQSVVINGVPTPVFPGAPTGIPGLNVGEALLAATVFRYDTASVNVNYSRPRTEVGASWLEGRGRSPYGATAANTDRDDASGNVFIRRRVTPSVSFNADAYYQKYQPLNALFVGQVIKTEQVGVNWQTGAQFALRMLVEHQNWQSSAAGGSFSDNLVYFGVVYGPPRHFHPVGFANPATRTLAPIPGI